MSVQPRRPTPILFTHYGEEWIRGSERCLLDLLSYIDRGRFAPVLWCNAETLASTVRALEVPVHVNQFTILFNWVPPRFDFGNYSRLVTEGLRLVSEHQIRLLHSNSAAPTQWLAPVARSAALPLLTHLHAPYNLRERIITRTHQATLAVGVTHGCIEGLLEDGMPEARTTTIYNGVDFSGWQGWDESGLRARLGIGPDEIVITQVGSLIHRKGHDILLHAFAGLRRERPQCHLIIVGDGPDRPAIEAAAGELGLGSSVHFLGFIASPTGVVFRDATDIAVSPSRTEGFGLTVIEAGAAGRPVVATDTTGMREIITHDENGLIVPVEDPAQLRDALRRLVDDPSLRARLGSRLKRVVQERFEVRRYVANLEAAYERLLAIPQAALGRGSGRWPGQIGLYARWASGLARRRLARLVGR